MASNPDPLAADKLRRQVASVGSRDMSDDEEDVPIRVDFRDPATARTWIEETRIKRPRSQHLADLRSSPTCVSGFASNRPVRAAAISASSPR